MKASQNINPHPPQIKREELRPVGVAAPKDDNLFEDFLLKDADFSKSECRDARFLTGIVTRSKFDQTKFLQPKLVDVLIENSYFSNADWEKSHLSRVAITSSKLTGFHAIQGKWNDVVIKESKADLSLFTLKKMKNVVFDDCILTDADFQECEMENMKFYNCDLTGASFLGAKLKNVDLRGSKIEKIKLDPAQFKGIIIEPSQAAYLIGATGAKVAWLGDE
jgi:uncharacterized protein YjbI with pentapeptide repeats